jgi:hypothetical protein
MIFSISASQIVRITGVNHCASSTWLLDAIKRCDKRKTFEGAAYVTWHTVL